MLPARVADFASVAKVEQRKPAPAATPQARQTEIRDRVAQYVKEAIAGDSRVWIFAASLDGTEDQWVTFSQEYLNNAVAARIQRDEPPPSDDMQPWLNTELPKLVESAMAAMSARPGRAILTGSRRPVWVLPAAVLSLASGKALRSQKIEVTVSTQA